MCGARAYSVFSEFLRHCKDVSLFPLWVSALSPHRRQRLLLILCSCGDAAVAFHLCLPLTGSSARRRSPGDHCAWKPALGLSLCFHAHLLSSLVISQGHKLLRTKLQSPYLSSGSTLITLPHLQWETLLTYRPGTPGESVGDLGLALIWLNHH